MKRLALVFLPLCFVALYPNPVVCGSAAIDALGTAGAGVSFDAENTGTMMAFGGLNTYLSKSAILDVFSRTVYTWTDKDDVEEVQGIEELLVSKKEIYKGWFACIGAGMTINVQNPDEGDKTYFNLLAETGYKLYGIDFFVGGKVSSVGDGKHKAVYAGISLN